MTTVVYRYHCEPATVEDATTLATIVRLASDYRRDLARIENRARLLLRLLHAQPSPEMRAVIFEQQKIAGRAARARAVAAGLHWGTYQAAEEAHSDACRSTKIYDDVRTFVPGDVGCAAVHLQPARPLAEATEWIKIGGPIRRGSAIDKSGRVRPTRHREVTLRVGTTATNEPLRVTLCVLLHRELPTAAVVSWARVIRRRVGSKIRWELLVTLQRAAPPRAATQTSHAVGVDIGWRHLDGHVRIATWWGTDGRSGEVRIADTVLGADAKADSLRAIRDEHKAAIRTRLRAWVQDLAARTDLAGAEMPWIVEATRHSHAWLKTGRFVRLVAAWRDQRIAGDAEIYAAMLEWLKHGRHLWDWEAAARVKRARRVDYQIRLLAVTLARHYDRIGVESPFVARLMKGAARCDACTELVKRCNTCRETERMRRIAATRVPHAAPARTRQEIKTFGAAYGALVVEIDPAYTTMDCAACAYRRDDVTDWSPRVIGCLACGVAEDQDLTAAKNLARLASAAVVGEDGKLLAPGKSRTSGRRLANRRTRKAGRVDRSQSTT